MEQQTRGCCRLLLYDTYTCELSSLELKTPLFGDDSTVRKHSCPFMKKKRGIGLLCSGNGLVCAISKDYHDGNCFYIWNPTTGFFKQIPDSRVSSEPYYIEYHGCGYLFATDDFKFLLAGKEKEEKEAERENTEKKQVVEIFSWRAHVWKAIEVPEDMLIKGNGILLNEALHWLGESGGNKVIFAFDLAKEEFRRMSIPILNKGDRDEPAFGGITVSVGKCMCLYRLLVPYYCYKHFGEKDCSLELWMMTEYDVGDSWTKLCRLRFSSIPRAIYNLKPLLVMEDSVLVEKWTGDAEAIRVDYDGVIHEKKFLMTGGHENLEYEESLIRLDDHGVEEPKAKRLYISDQ